MNNEKEKMTYRKLVSRYSKTLDKQNKAMALAYKAYWKQLKKLGAIK